MEKQKQIEERLKQIKKELVDEKNRQRQLQSELESKENLKDHTGNKEGYEIRKQNKDKRDANSKTTIVNHDLTSDIRRLETQIDDEAFKLSN